MNTETTKLLLVDDEAGLRRSLNFGLTQRGFELDESEEGLPALKLIESSYSSGKPYRLVLLDINLPDIDGLKLLELIKSKYPNLPVVVISAYGTEMTQSRVTSRQGDAYLDKPFLVDELTDLLAALPAAQAAPDRAPAPELAAQTVSAYAMVRLTKEANVVETFRALYFMDNVIWRRENPDTKYLQDAPVLATKAQAQEPERLAA